MSHTVKSGSTLQSLTALSVGEAEFCAVVKGCQVGLSLICVYMDLGIQMKVELRSDSSTANSMTDRLGPRPRTKHIDTRFFGVQERAQDGDLSMKKFLTATNCADVGTKPVSASEQQQHCKFEGLVFCRVGILLTFDFLHVFQLVFSFFTILLFPFKFFCLPFDLFHLFPSKIVLFTFSFVLLFYFQLFTLVEETALVNPT